MEPKKRLFFAIQPEGLKDSPEIQTLVKKLRIGVDRRGWEVKWTPDVNWHFTLSFVGETEEERVPEMLDILKNVAEHGAHFNLPLKGVGAFPSEREARVLWVGAPAKRSLVELQQTLAGELEKRGFPIDERGYRPHLTVGRLRNPKGVGDLISPFVRNKFGEFQVTEILLMESVQARFFPVYKILAREPLMGLVSE
ncbi:MAG: RNA 2',3'-cyclic phosphodiesterase [Bdellovibrionaceae bacterium]|nr:RNA 2',3'-cyclic phosphodiesterase [Bdellovibrionales bacterium]MCB9082750.1 RNA 2',3'-cyclic phosphodiesterase [Pseudobdellovibrionaceae bacterium]